MLSKKKVRVVDLGGKTTIGFHSKIYEHPIQIL
jgi:hypothetical protein